VFCTRGTENTSPTVEQSIILDSMSHSQKKAYSYGNTWLIRYSKRSRIWLSDSGVLAFGSLEVLPENSPMDLLSSFQASHLPNTLDIRILYVRKSCDKRLFVERALKCLYQISTVRLHQASFGTRPRLIRGLVRFWHKLL
jgi:hypothetical protein